METLKATSARPVLRCCADWPLQLPHTRGQEQERRISIWKRTALQEHLPQEVLTWCCYRRQIGGQSSAGRRHPAVRDAGAPHLADFWKWRASEAASGREQEYIRRRILVSGEAVASLWVTEQPHLTCSPLLGKSALHLRIHRGSCGGGARRSSGSSLGAMGGPLAYTASVLYSTYSRRALGQCNSHGRSRPETPNLSRSLSLQRRRRFAKAD